MWRVTECGFSSPADPARQLKLDRPILRPGLLLETTQGQPLGHLRRVAGGDLSVDSLEGLHSLVEERVKQT
jgi:hypothetical protein